MFTIFKKAGASRGAVQWMGRWSQAGVVLSREGDQGTRVTNPLLDGYLTQLTDDGLATEDADGYTIGWDALYAALALAEYAALPEVLSLPRLTETRPVLQSRNSLTDADFSVAIAGWQGAEGRALDYEINGPVMSRDEQVELMRPEQWQLYKEVIGFAGRPDEERNDLAHRQAWGQIRRLASVSNARLDDFLYRSVVLTPEKLEIGLRRSDAVADDRVIEIEPGFAGAPQNWLTAFDRSKAVRDRYDIVTPDGIVQVLVTSKVRTVLEEIKRLPNNRRVAGSRAQAFLLNPYATLGADAVDVIVEEQFEQAREAAGLEYERFVPVFERDAAGYPLRVGLLIETASSSGPASSDTQWLNDEELAAFIRALKRALGLAYQLVAWNGYEFELQGDTRRHHDELMAALERRRSPPTLVSYAQVHDLAGYSSRVEAIGVEKPYYSPYIAKKQEGDGWFPENVLPVVVYQPAGEAEPVAVPTSKAAIEQLEKAVMSAKAVGETEVSVSWLPGPIALSEATHIAQTFHEVFKDVEKGAFDPDQKRGPTPNEVTGRRKQLVLRANIQSLEYEELRREALESVPTEPRIPRQFGPSSR